MSDKQWRDIVSILRVNRGALDAAYLAQWAERLRCQGLIASAEQEASD